VRSTESRRVSLTHEPNGRNTAAALHCPHTSPIIVRPVFPAPPFRVKAATLGYTFDVLVRGSARVGAGMNYTAYRFPEVLKVFYGARPRSHMLYVRTRWGV
jgi:hypothetical protein